MGRNQPTDRGAYCFIMPSWFVVLFSLSTRLRLPIPQPFSQVRDASDTPFWAARLGNRWCEGTGAGRGGAGRAT